MNWWTKILATFSCCHFIDAYYKRKSGILKNILKHSQVSPPLKSRKEVTHTQQIRIWINYCWSPVKPHKSVKATPKCCQVSWNFQTVQGIWRSPLYFIIWLSLVIRFAPQYQHQIFLFSPSFSLGFTTKGKVTVFALIFSVFTII